MNKNLLNIVFAFGWIILLTVCFLVYTDFRDIGRVGINAIGYLIGILPGIIFGVRGIKNLKK